MSTPTLTVRDMVLARASCFGLFLSYNYTYAIFRGAIAIVTANFLKKRTREVIFHKVETDRVKVDKNGGRHRVEAAKFHN